MPKLTRKKLATSQTLTKRDLAEILRTEGRSISAEDGDGLKTFARWLVNANIKKFTARVDVSNQDIIRVLTRVKHPGPVREVVKSWLVTRLFKRSRQADNTAPYFLAQPDDEEDLIAAGNLMAADEAEMGVTSNRALLQAVVHFSRGDVDTAYVKYDEMRKGLLAGEYVGPHTQGALSIRSLGEFSQVIDAARLGQSIRAPIQFERSQHFTEKKSIVVIGVDPVYHDRYAARMVDSVNGAFNIHFHVCNPGNMTFLNGDNVRYSLEINPAATAPFYATMRFLALRQILQTYEAPVMTLDADSVSNGEVAGLFNILPDFDIALNTSKDSRGVLPWRFLIAQVVGANPTEAAHEFWRSFEAQFDHLMAQDGGVTWYVDQALLTSTLLLTQQRQPQTRLLVRGLSSLSGTTQSKV